MNLFDQWVDEVLQQNPGLGILRPVVEKELLHRDLLEIFHRGGLLKKLVFMGGTCLRACYGSRRLSEDLDFYGGTDFSPDSLADLPKQIKFGIGKKYGFPLHVQEPRQDRTQVRTWEITIQTRPERKDLPSQRIHVDICMLDAVDARPMMLNHPYAGVVGGSGFILNAASREEIYVDKLVAFALRPGRIKFRDVWDLHWLRQQKVALRLPWVYPKVEGHGQSVRQFQERLLARLDTLTQSPELQQDGYKELSRFLLKDQIVGLVDHPDFWTYFCSEFKRDLDPILSD